MSCSACNQNLEETDLMAELPCCGIVMHSKCALELVANASYNSMSVYCPGCGESLWSHSSYSTPQLPPPQAFLDEVKTLKPIVSQYKKSLLAFRRKVSQSKQEFKTLVAPYIDQIKAAKKTAKEALKASDEYKTYFKFHRSYMRNAKALATKYDLPLRAVNQKFRILWWRSNPTMYINKNLYIPI